MSKKLSTDELLTRAERLARKDHGGRFSIFRSADGYRGHFGEVGETVFGPTDSANEVLDVMVGSTIPAIEALEPLDEETRTEIAQMEADEERLSTAKAEGEL